MAYILILLLIPIFFVGVVVYCSTLYTFMMTNELDMVLLMIGLFSSLISSFVIVKEFSLLKIDDIFIIKLQEKTDSLVGMISFLFLLLFGISLIINASLVTFNLTKLVVGIAIVLFYIYVLYFYVFRNKELEFKMVSNKEINKKLFLYTFENKDYGEKSFYSKTKLDLKKRKAYKVKYSLTNQRIRKIIGEVTD